MDERELEALLGFSDADLAANRDGRLSPAQAGSLRWSGVWRLIVGPPMLVGWTVLAVVAVESALLTLGALLAAGFGLYVTWRGFAFLVDAMETTVAYLTGPLKRKAVRGRNGTTYYASIGPVTRRVKAAAYNRLSEGGSFHLYYAPGCRRLLSAEPASAMEPLPSHRFGPDSAHIWDRLRWTWVFMTIGLLGALIGAHEIASAHPAHPVAVNGTVTNYVETHGRSTSRTLYLDGTSFTPQDEANYSPPVAPFGTLIGKKVVLYVNDGTSDVIGIDDGEHLYAADWYLHPEQQTAFEIRNGAVTATVSVIALILAMATLVQGRLRTGRSDPSDPNAPAALYAPPTVRPLQAMWPSFLFMGGLMAAVMLLAFLANGHR